MFKKPVVSIVGRSEVGKTTLIEKLIPELKRRGWQVGTIKHHAHPGLELDVPGKDSWRHAQAGSDHVMVISPDRVASLRRVEQAPTLEQALEEFREVDLVITDGFKRGGAPKIEVLRQAVSREPICTAEELLAVAADFSLDWDVPWFHSRDVEGLVDFIERQVLGGETRRDQSAG
jgi:molybdopterin-guanine dinucleotide biosynthesis protein MobB